MYDISIVTVCLNSELSIPRTIQSLRVQKNVTIDHVVVDGGSIDNTCNIVRSLRPETRIFSLPGSSIYEALNFGIKKCHSNVIGILHSNDEFSDKHSLEYIKAQFVGDVELDVFCGSALVVDNLANRKPYRYIDSVLFGCRFLLKFGFMPAHTGLFHTIRVFDEVGGYDTSYYSAADFKFCWKIFYESRTKFKYKLSRKIVTVMSAGGTSSSGIKSYIQTSREVSAILADEGVHINFLCHLFRLIIKKFHSLLTKNLH